MNSVILDIPNTRQVADGLCWAACLAPVVSYLTGRSFSQRALAGATGRSPDLGASILDMQRVIANTTNLTASLTKPLSAETARDHLSHRRPLILVVDVGEGIVAHSLCLRGLVHDGQWQAVVNEPNLATGHSILIPFARLHAAWREGLVIARSNPRSDICSTSFAARPTFRKSAAMPPR